MIIGLTSVSPTSGYPTIDLYRYVHFIHAVHDGIHPFDHRLLQPGLCVHRAFCIALDDYLVVADENRYGRWTLVPTLPQKRQCQLQAVGCGSLDRRALRQLVSLSGIEQRRVCSASNTLTDGVPKVPEAPLTPFWHLVTLDRWCET
jgi:hypothetical protein